MQPELVEIVSTSFVAPVPSATLTSRPLPVSDWLLASFDHVVQKPATLIVSEYTIVILSPCFHLARPCHRRPCS